MVGMSVGSASTGKQSLPLQQKTRASASDGKMGSRTFSTGAAVLLDHLSKECAGDIRASDWKLPLYQGTRGWKAMVFLKPAANSSGL